jgi:hypothetical protein
MYRPFSVLENALEVNRDWPSTRDAGIPFENGALNSSTLLLNSSLTHRFPVESNFTSVGKKNPRWLVAGVREVKPGWPRTNEAFIPVLNGGLNSRTRSFPRSAVQRLPDESKARPEG